MHPIRRVMVLLVAASITLSLLISGTAIARANPAPTPMSSAPSYGTSAHPSKSQWNAMTRAKNTIIANDFRVGLDYRIAKRKFGDHATWRREFAAGWIFKGYITHISSTELKKVRQIRDNYRRSPALAPTPMNGCSGVTKIVHHNTSRGSETWEYLNSCRTSDRIEAYGGVMALGGFFGTIAGIAKLHPAGAAIMACLVGTAWLTKHQYVHAQNNSSKHAVIVKTIDYGYNPTAGVHYYSTEVVRQ